MTGSIDKDVSLGGRSVRDVGGTDAKKTYPFEIPMDYPLTVQVD